MAPIGYHKLIFTVGVGFLVHAAISATQRKLSTKAHHITQLFVENKKIIDFFSNYYFSNINNQL